MLKSRFRSILFYIFLGMSLSMVLLLLLHLYPDVQETLSLPGWRSAEDSSLVDATIRWDHPHEEQIHQGTALEASKLEKQVRVLCWIMTSPQTHMTKAIHVKRTWGSHCNKLLFISSEEDPALGSIKIPNAQEGRAYLWIKTMEAFKLIYFNYLNDYDWFLKADDDTFVIVENLRFMLKNVDTEDPIYYGCRFKKFLQQGYMSGGAGYVLSREAVRRFVEKALPNPHFCSTVYQAEDVQMGRCLENVGVKAGDSRDSLGRSRFHPFYPKIHLNPKLLAKSSWYPDYIYYPHKKGIECCSDTTISFHYIEPSEMYVLDFLIYHLRPYGTLSNSAPPGAPQGQPRANNSTN